MGCPPLVCFPEGKAQERARRKRLIARETPENKLDTLPVYPYTARVVRVRVTAAGFWAGRGKSGHHKATRPVKAGDAGFSRPGGRPVQQKANRPHLRVRVRVKRGGKSSPLRRQRRRHCKPRVVQDKQGKGRLPAGSPGNSRTGPVKRSGTLRREKNGHTALLNGSGQNLAYRTRTTPSFLPSSEEVGAPGPEPVPAAAAGS